MLGEASVEGGAGRLGVALEANAGLAGFFLPQLNQSVLGILNALLVVHPGNKTAEIVNNTAKTCVVRERRFRMANASLNRRPTREVIAPGGRSGSILAAVQHGQYSEFYPRHVLSAGKRPSLLRDDSINQSFD